MSSIQEVPDKIVLIKKMVQALRAGIVYDRLATATRCPQDFCCRPAVQKPQQTTALFVRVYRLERSGRDEAADDFVSCFGD